MTMFPLKNERFFPLKMEIGANLSPENVTGVLLNQKYILKFVKDTNEHIQFLGGCRIFGDAMCDGRCLFLNAGFMERIRPLKNRRFH